MRVFIPLFAATFTLLIGAGQQKAQSEYLPDWDIETEAFLAELIVVCSVGEAGPVTVEEVLFGTVKQGERLDVERLHDLPKTKYESVDEAWNIRGIRGDKRASTLTGRAVLFLSKNDRQQWTTTGWGAGVKWLVMEKVYAYSQWSNPGPYYLLPDGANRTEGDLRKAIERAVVKKSQFIAAQSVATPQGRVNSLGKFVEPEEKNGFYLAAALEELAKTGPPAVNFLRSQAERGEQRPRRTQFLKALGSTHDREAISYLLDVVDQSAPIVKAMAQFQRKDATEAERQAMGNWYVGISALAKNTDRRALPALREAMAWGAEHWAENRILENASHGLEKMPDRENIPVLAKAIAAIPVHEYDWVAKLCCVRALGQQQFPEAIPILADQLLTPLERKRSPVNQHREYNSRIAHAALRKIVGEDLGDTKQRWLEWFAARKRVGIPTYNIRIRFIVVNLP